MSCGVESAYRYLGKKCREALESLPRPRRSPRRPGGGQIAVVCEGAVSKDACPADDEVCMVGAERLAPGFRHCIVSEMEGDYAECPSSDGAARRTFSERFTFWLVRHDGRACTPCACTQTAPSTCEAIVSTFEDEACEELVASAAIGAAAASPADRVCHDAQPQTALGSMRAAWRVNAPGSCVPSGGELVGELVLERRTLCCLPEGT
jgi:hypothetical protein